MAAGRGGAKPWQGGIVPIYVPGGPRAQVTRQVKKARTPPSPSSRAKAQDTDHDATPQSPGGRGTAWWSRRKRALSYVCARLRRHRSAGVVRIRHQRHAAPAAAKTVVRRPDRKRPPVALSPSMPGDDGPLQPRGIVGRHHSPSLPGPTRKQVRIANGPSAPVASSSYYSSSA